MGGLTFDGKGIKIWWGKSIGGGGFSRWEGGNERILTCWGGIPPIPPVGKTLDSRYVQVYRWISMFTLVGEGIENQVGGSYKCEEGD